jgi:ubiquinone/menaquinone biosynthesis C-methylase UbiE
MPIRNGTVDALYVNFTHHISDEMLIRFLNEGKRVLKDADRFILVDAFLKPGWLERLLWKEVFVSTRFLSTARA